VAETPLRVAMICTGNICRSPMAEVVVKQLIDADSSLRGCVDVTSAGTANWHVGSPMDERARRALDRAGFFHEGSLAAFADRAYLDQQDIVIGMTREHVHEVKKRLSNQATEVILLRNLIDPGRELDLFDPYYGDDVEFDECLDVVTRGGQRLTSEFRRRLDEGSSEA
jgi:low molecular weight protein-tyrosine phosphatase